MYEFCLCVSVCMCTVVVCMYIVCVCVGVTALSSLTHHCNSLLKVLVL